MDISNYFDILKFLTILSAILTVNVRNPVQSVLLLIAVFFNTAAILLVLNLDFLAFTYLTVYIGAIAVLFLFVVMMIDIQPVDASLFSSHNYTFFSLIYIFFSFELANNAQSSFSYFEPIYLTYMPNNIDFAPLLEDPSNIKVIGTYLFLFEFLPFLITGIILLIVLVGVIMLTMHQSEGLRRQSVLLQNTANLRNSIRFITK